MKNFARASRLLQQGGGDSGMYVAREKIYPREIDGRFQRLRHLAVLVLLGFYYIGPWLNWDGRQALLFDLPERKFYVFGLVFWPQDFFFLALLLIICALALFFFTALAGRLWCGYACPQTVWTEAFLWMERLVEGNRNRQMKLDKAPWTRDKIRKKFAKHSLWIIFALWTGFTFVGYFTPVDVLASKVFTLDTGPWETFWVLFYGFATWGNAGFLREQVCIYMCPYARFQSAMFDQDTLIIAYDEERGEPRGSRRKSVPDVATRAAAKAAESTTHEIAEGMSKGKEVALDMPGPDELGECIDCEICVQVCPTGIDIREGLQYECIACAACVDACDSVMDKMNYPRGLIKYSTQHAIDHKTTHVLRPRMIIYGLLLLAISTAWVTGIAMKKPVAMDILRDRNALYRLRDGMVENVYTLKIMNKTTSEQQYSLDIEGLDGLSLDTDNATITVPAGDVATIPARLTIAAETARGGGHDIFIVLTTMDGTTVREETRFYLPVE